MDSCPSVTTRPDTLFSVEMVSTVTSRTWTATPAGALSWEVLSPPPDWQAVRPSVKAAARAREKICFSFMDRSPLI